MNLMFYRFIVNQFLEIVEIQTEEMVIRGSIGGGKPPVTRFYWNPWTPLFTVLFNIICIAIIMIIIIMIFTPLYEQN